MRFEPQTKLARRSRTSSPIKRSGRKPTAPSRKRSSGSGTLSANPGRGTTTTSQMTPTPTGHTEAAGGESRQRWTVSPSWTASPANRLVAKMLLGHCTNRRPSSALTWQTETSRRRSATPKYPSPMTYWIPLPRMT